MIDKRITGMAIILILLVTSRVIFSTGAIGPYDSFSKSPLQFWDYYNSDVVLSYNTTSQTVVIDDALEFKYMKKIMINGSAGAGNDYQVLLNVTYDSDMQNDFDDLRFFDDDLITSLDYWLEDYTVSSFALVWVEVKDDLGSDQEMYMVYGNEAASSTSSGDNTFREFMDFEEGDTSDTNSSTGSVQSSVTHVRSGTYSLRAYNYPPSSTGGQTYTNDFFDDYGLRGWFYDDGDTSVDNIRALQLSSDTNFRIGVYTGQSTTHYIYSDGSYHTTALTRSVGWHSIDYELQGGNCVGYLDEIQIFSVAVPSNTDGFMGINYKIDSSWFDDLIVRKYVFSEPVVDSWGDKESTYSSMAIGIPLMLQDDQEILCVFDTVFLSENASMVYMNFSGDVTSGFGVAVNSTGIGSGPMWVNHSGYSRVTFEIDNQRRLFSVKVDDEQGIRKLIYETYEYLTANDWFNITSNGIIGNLTMYGFSGSTDYRIERVYNDIEEWFLVTDDDDPGNIQQGLYNFEIIDPDDDVSGYDVHWRRHYTYFSWLRLVQDWMFMLDQGTGDYACSYFYEFRWRLWYPNGTERVDVTFQIEMTSNSVGGGDNIDSSLLIEVDGVDQNILIAQNDDSYLNNGEGMAHIGIWRNLDNRVGVMWSSDCYVYTMDGWDDPFVNVEDHIVWMSEYPVDDWANSTVDIRYHGDPLGEQTTTGTAQVYSWFNYEGVEWCEYVDSGVVEPHFSSFWADMFRLLPGGREILDIIDAIWGTGGEDHDRGNRGKLPDLATYWFGEFNLTPFLDVIGSLGGEFLNAILIGTSPINNILNQILAQLPDDIAAALGMSGFDFNLGGIILRGVVGAFGEGFLGLFDLLGSAIGIIGSLVGVIGSLFGLLIIVLGTLVYYFNVGYVFVIDNMEIIGFLLCGAPIVAYITLGERYARDVIGLYKWALFGTLDLVWRVFFGVINTIGNWMPFT